MRFTKMEGLGNDYIYVNGFTEIVDDPPTVARAVSDRHFGIGADGLILIRPSDVASVRMDMYNADGSASEMCGNGLRCVAWYAVKHGLVTERRFHVETGRGILEVEVLRDDGDRTAKVLMDMGPPMLDRAEIPMTGKPGRVVQEPLEVLGETLKITAVSLGNPHAVIYVNNAERHPVQRIGPVIENHKAFPNRVNVEFVEVRSPGEVAQRTWERGSGETLACGTGAAAVTVAGILTGLTGSPLIVHLRGGDLLVEWDGEGSVRQTGPARIVFSGDWIG